jgi:carboxyl-terminal processing protease
VLSANAQALQDGSFEGVVIDLRGNPGGLLSQAVNVADLFVHEGRIIATVGRHPDSYHDYRADGGDLAHGLPLAILLDGSSASSAEIVASALEDLGRAVVIGSTSYGKGTVQTVIRLPNDGEVTLTWSRFISPSGYAIHGLGVMPAVCATDPNLPKTPSISDKDASGLTDAILAPAHIDGYRNTMEAWHAAGLIFDGRRATLRSACPAKTLRPGKNGDLLMKLATRVIQDPALYQRAILLSQPISTASR